MWIIQDNIALCNIWISAEFSWPPNQNSLYHPYFHFRILVGGILANGFIMYIFVQIWITPPVIRNACYWTPWSPDMLVILIYIWKSLCFNLCRFSYALWGIRISCCYSYLLPIFLCGFLFIHTKTYREHYICHQ